MIQRFKGEIGKRILSDLLHRQPLLQGNQSLISDIIKNATIKEIEKGELFIEQDGTDNEIYFILTGRISIEINGYEVAIRKAGQHVGEMAAIDPSAKRSATVVALENTVVAFLTEQNLNVVANEHPQIWKLIAVELSERLRERTKFIRPSNPRPVLFIGSSKESLQYAREIQSALHYDDIIAKLWTDGGVFNSSHYPIEDLQTQVERADFAMMILGGDDMVTSRKVSQNAPRDNVIFELGLFMGVISRKRTFMLVPRGLDIKIPSDLLGVNYLTFEENGDLEGLPTNLAPICNQIRKVILKLGTR